jgi:hypothetical protein
MEKLEDRFVDESNKKRQAGLAVPPLFYFEPDTF